MWSIQKPTRIGTFKLLSKFIQIWLEMVVLNMCVVFVSSVLLVFRALFGYEGHTNILKVVSNGNGGLIELTDELNSGKILYAFVKITNDKTNLTKYLIINWQVS